MSYTLYLGSGKGSSISYRLYHSPSNIHFLPPQKASSWLPTSISGFNGLEHRKMYDKFTIVLSKNRVKTRVLSLSLGLAEITATAADKVNKPVDLSVLVPTRFRVISVCFVPSFLRTWTCSYVSLFLVGLLRAAHWCSLCTLWQTLWCRKSSPGSLMKIRRTIRVDQLWLRAEFQAYMRKDEGW